MNINNQDTGDGSSLPPESNPKKGDPYSSEALGKETIGSGPEQEPGPRMDPLEFVRQLQQAQGVEQFGRKIGDPELEQLGQTDARDVIGKLVEADDENPGAASSFSPEDLRKLMGSGSPEQVENPPSVEDNADTDA